MVSRGWGAGRGWRDRTKLGEPVQRTDRRPSKPVISIGQPITTWPVAFGGRTEAPGAEPPASLVAGRAVRRADGYERLKYSFEDTMNSTSFSSVVPDCSLLTHEVISVGGGVRRRKRS